MKAYLPSNLDLDIILQANAPHIKNFKKEHLIYFLNLIYSVPACNKKLLFDDYTSLKSTYLQKVNHNYKQYFQYAIDNNIIECDGHYIENEKSMGYRFTERYRTGKLLKFYNLQDKKIKQNQPANKPAKYKHLYKHFDGLKIDVGGALKYLEKHADFIQEFAKLEPVIKYRMNNGVKEYVKTVQHRKDAQKFYFSTYMNIKNLSEKNFKIHVDGKCGRFHSVLTNMKKELRNFITYKGEALVAVDLKNSQPYLSQKLFEPKFYINNKDKTIFDKARFDTSSKAYQIIQTLYIKDIFTLVNKLSDPVNTDVIAYLDTTANGKFYEDLQEKIMYDSGEIIEDRNELKSIIFHVFFTANRYMNDHKKLFKKHYPHVYELFKFIKNAEDKNGKSDKANLAILLQNIESKLILDIICKRISEERPNLPIFTIHDSIVTTVGNEMYLKNVMEEELEKHIGRKPSLELEYWKPENAYNSLQKLYDKEQIAIAA